MATPRIEAFPVQISPSLLQRRVVINGRICPPARVDGRPLLFDSFLSPRGAAIHHAIDITAPEGAAIVSPASGRVLQSWRLRGEDRGGSGSSEKGGWYVRMKADDGFIHYFAHMQFSPLVSNGQRVRAGQVLGYVGRTGNAITTCPHLHYSITAPGGRKVNPFPLLRPSWLAGGWRMKQLSPREAFTVVAMLAAPFAAMWLDKRLG